MHYTKKVFYSSWQWLGDKGQFTIGQGATPIQLLNGYLEEPIIVTRNDAGELSALSNICTHRANQIIHNQEDCKQLVCRYHGRRFDLKGKFKHMPEFGEAIDFPRACDELPSFDLKQWGPFLFTSLSPKFSFEKIKAGR